MNELIFVLSAISTDVHVHLRASSAANELNAAKRKLLRPWRDGPEPRQLIRKDLLLRVSNQCKGKVAPVPTVDGPRELQTALCEKP